MWVPIGAALGGVVLLVLLSVLGRARYRKEQYELSAERIILRSGGLVSDAEVEVHYPNITQVKWIRPWLRHRLFGVGDLHIEVAGSGAGAITLRDLSQSEAVQTQIREYMGQVFSMRTDVLLHEERPARRGILIDIVAKGGWVLVAFVFAVGMELGPMLWSLKETGLGIDAEDVAGLRKYAGWLLLGIPVIVLVALLTTLQYLDLKRRVYRVYNGLIEYREGFLTRNNAFIPVENLSNSEVSRGITERIANLYNVVLSCQGAGHEVRFLYLRRGPELQEVIDRLINQNEVPSPGPSPEVSSTAVERSPLLADSAVSPEVLTYRMHPGRTLVSLLIFLPLVPICFFVPALALVFLFQIVFPLVRLFRTTFTLRRNSVEEHFNFVRVEQREFSKDKITGLYISENILDRMFQTVSIQFWSIGTGKPITFRNVRKTDELLAAAKERAGLQFGPELESIHSQYNLARGICGSLPAIAGLGLLAAGACVAAALVHWLYTLLIIPMLALLIASLLYGQVYYPRSRLKLYGQGLVFHRGIFMRSSTWARFENIKDITTIKIPGYDVGSMRFNVAGERNIGQGAKQGLPYGFTMRYVSEILSKDEWFDYEILAKSEVPVPHAEGGIEARKALGNSAIKTIAVSTVLFPLLLILPFTLTIALWRAHLVRYRIEPGRVLMRSGRLFRRQTSILFSRIDHIQSGRGALNKLIGNGNIVISTAGSSRPELLLRDVKDHEAFYKALQDHHRGHPSDNETQPETGPLPGSTHTPPTDDTIHP